MRHIICCFVEHRSIARTDLSDGPPISGVAEKLSPGQVRAVMWFATALAEEVSKTNVSTLTSHGFYEEMKSNTPDMTYIFDKALNATATSSIAEEAIKCFQSWVMCIQRVWSDQVSDLKQLRTLTPDIIDGLHHEQLFEVAADFLVDTLDNFPGFLSNDDLSRLAEVFTGKDADNVLQEFKGGDLSNEATLFGRLILAYGDATVQDLARAMGSSTRKKLLGHYITLLDCKGYAGVDEHISTQALEFWQTYVEFLTDSLFDPENNAPAWAQEARHKVFEVIDTCWRKIQIPDPNIAAAWSSSERSDFHSFRMDVQDLLQASYTLLGLKLYETLAGQALKSIATESWVEVEASLFCLNSLADAVSEEAVADHFLGEVLDSSLLNFVSDPSNKLPAKTQHTVMSLVTANMPFFQRHSQFLPRALRCLFDCLRMTALASEAAKATFAACSTCRQVLYPHLDFFLQQYTTLVANDSVDTYVKNMVMGSIAAIVQAIPSNDQQLTLLHGLLSIIDEDIVAFEVNVNSGDRQNAQVRGLSALRSLESLAKGLETPNDVSISVDTTDSQDPRSGFWTEGPGASFQEKIVQTFVKLTSYLRSDPDITDAVCDILRSGFRETVAGPFVLPYNVTSNLLLASPSNSAEPVGRLEYIISTATLMFNKRTGASHSRVMAVAPDCLRYVGETVDRLLGILEITHNCQQTQV